MDDNGRLTPREKALLAVVLGGAFLVSFNQTVIAPALPGVMAQMDVDISVAQWLTSGYTIVNAGMIPMTAFFKARFSVRSLFAFSMACFLGGCLLCFWSVAFAILLVGRLLQAVASGIVMPVTMMVLLATFPSGRRGAAMGVYGFIMAVSPSIGPTLAGIAIDNASWQLMFLVIGGFAAVEIVLSIFVLEGGNALHGDAHLDWPSVVLSASGLTLLLYGFSTMGLESRAIESCIAAFAGVAVIVAFGARQLRLDSPMLQVRLLGTRRFLIGTAIGMVIQASLFTAIIALPVYVQDIRGLSSTLAGLMMAPMAIVMCLFNIVSGRIYDSHGARAVGIAGTGMLALSTGFLAFLDLGSSLTLMTCAYAVRGIGIGLANMPLMTWSMEGLDGHMMTHATAMSNTLKQASSSFGTALTTSAMSLVMSSSAQMPYLDAYCLSIDVAFLIVCALSTIALVLVLVFVRNPEKNLSFQ